MLNLLFTTPDAVADDEHSLKTCRDEDNRLIVLKRKKLKLLTHCQHLPKIPIMSFDAIVVDTKKKIGN